MKYIVFYDKATKNFIFSWQKINISLEINRTGGNHWQAKALEASELNLHAGKIGNDDGKITKDEYKRMFRPVLMGSIIGSVLVSYIFLLKLSVIFISFSVNLNLQNQN